MILSKLSQLHSLHEAREIIVYSGVGRRNTVNHTKIVVMFIPKNAFLREHCDNWCAMHTLVFTVKECTETKLRTA